MDSVADGASCIINVYGRYRGTIGIEGVYMPLTGWILSHRHVLSRHPLTKEFIVVLYANENGRPYSVVEKFQSFVPELKKLPCDVRDIVEHMLNETV